jgi:hypothetical protein
MNEHDPLEAELAALRPHEPSPELKQRLAERLDRATTSRPAERRKNIRWIGALAGGLIAAGVVAMIIWRRGDETIVPPAPDVSVEATTAAAFDDSLPSFWSYRAALAESPEAVDALLDRHAAGNTELKPGRARVYFFARYDSDLNPLAGEL